MSQPGIEACGSNRPLRVVLLTRDGAYSRCFLKSFLSCLESGAARVVGGVLSTSLLRRATPWPLDLWGFLQRVGLRYALYQAYVAWGLPWARRREIGQGLGGKNRGWPVLATNDVNGAAARAWLQQRRPDVLLSFHFNQRMQPPVLELPRCAAINFHPSPLPHYRGVDPVLFALAAGERELGLTMHLISPELDEGDCLVQWRYPRQPGGLVGNNRFLFEQGGCVAAQTLNHLETTLARRLTQDATAGRYDGWTQVKAIRMGRVLWPGGLWHREKL